MLLCMVPLLLPQRLGDQDRAARRLVKRMWQLKSGARGNYVNVLPGIVRLPKALGLIIIVIMGVYIVLGNWVRNVSYQPMLLAPKFALYQDLSPETPQRLCRVDPHFPHRVGSAGCHLRLLAAMELVEFALLLLMKGLIRGECDGDSTCAMAELAALKFPPRSAGRGRNSPRCSPAPLPL